MKRNDRLFRKHMDTMMVLGMGYCFLGIWDLVRMVLFCTLNYPYLELIVQDNLPAEIQTMPDYDDFMIFIMAFMVIFMISFSLGGAALRLFVGLSARGDAKGKKKKAYITWLVIFVIVDIIAIVSQIVELNSDKHFELFDFIGSYLLSVTLLVITTDLLVSALYVRKYRKLDAAGELIETEKTEEEED